MREIKFRVYLDKMYYQDEYNEYDINLIGIDFLNKIVTFAGYTDGEEEDSFERYSFDENNILYKKDLKIMQYTGLKDKNNKEIYEGDIVKLRANHGIGVVKYYDEWGAFVVEYIKPRPLAVLGMNYYKEDIEILGNIYENPKLMEDE